MLWKFGNIKIVRWNNNSVVKIGINAYGVQPVGSAKRWIKGKGKQNIQQPAIIAAYNQWMGGVDLLDHTLSDLRLVIREIDGIHKCHQFCICIQLAAVSYCFW